MHAKAEARAQPRPCERPCERSPHSTTWAPRSSSSRRRCLPAWLEDLWGRQLEDAYLREPVVWVHECFMHMQKHLGNDNFVTHDRLLYVNSGGWTIASSTWRC